MGGRDRGENSWARADARELANSISAPETSKEIFFDSGLRIEKCVLASLRPPDLPSSLLILEVIDTTHQHDSGPKALVQIGPADATVVSARELQRGRKDVMNRQRIRSDFLFLGGGGGAARLGWEGRVCGWAAQLGSLMAGPIWTAIGWAWGLL